MKEPILGKIMFIVLLVVIVVALLLGGWFAYAKIFSKNKIDEVITTSTTQTDTIKEPTKVIIEETKTEISASTTTEVVNQQKNDTILFGEPVDTDSDGLDDIREKQLSTDPTKKDTDSDGLSDGDEVLIWKTNPLVEDTDGDGHIDGVEIKNGYNPLGPGKLYNVPTTNQTTSTN